jgi:hypothetical protein
VESERDAVAGEQILDLVRPGMKVLADNGDRLVPSAPLAPPLRQRLCHGEVELLVR